MTETETLVGEWMYKADDGTTHTYKLFAVGDPAKEIYRDEVAGDRARGGQIIGKKNADRIIESMDRKYVRVGRAS